MLQGEARLASLCDRPSSRDVHGLVRDVFCTEPRPTVTNSQELLATLGLPFEGPGRKDAQRLLNNSNPAWSLVGHTASLSRRTVSPVSPRYLDTGLVLGETYRYRVKMRDRAGNEGAFSPEASFALQEVELSCFLAPDDYPLTPGTDSDCDTVPDEDEGEIDTDGDGIPDFRDPDDDGDGFSTWTEREDGEIWGQDNDGDGLPTWLDTDSDGDGWSDALEGGGDNNDNMIPGYLDPDEPCGDGTCNLGAPTFGEDCTICPVDCPCENGTVCLEGHCG